MRTLPWFFAPVLLLLTPSLVVGQTSFPPNQATPFKDTSSLKPPPGARVAIIEYEDLECPYCARAFPVVHAAVNRYHLPLEEYDCQVPSHHWSHEAAVFAHYLRAKVSPEIALAYRSAVFAAQPRIATHEDLLRFTQTFMKDHGQAMPPVVDSSGDYDREVKATTAQALQMGVMGTPTILVVTPTRWIQVKDVDKLDAAIQQAEAEAHAAPPPAHHTTTHR